MIIIRTNLVELESSMLYTKIQPPSFLGSGDESARPASGDEDFNFKSF